MLSDRHRHTGAASDGGRINLRDIIDAERFLFIPATDFEETDANVAIAQLSSFAALVFTDGVTGVSCTTFMLPQTKKSIAGMQIVYYNQAASTNLYLSFNIERARESITDPTDSLASATYATGATVNTLDTIEIPKTVWDGLLQLNPFDVIGLKITRTAGNVADTYNADWKVFGLLVEFG